MICLHLIMVSFFQLFEDVRNYFVLSSEIGSSLSVYVDMSFSSLERDRLLFCNLQLLPISQISIAFKVDFEK